MAIQVAVAKTNQQRGAAEQPPDEPSGAALSDPLRSCWETGFPSFVGSVGVPEDLCGVPVTVGVLGRTDPELPVIRVQDVLAVAS